MSAPGIPGMQHRVSDPRNYIASKQAEVAAGNTSGGANGGTQSLAESNAEAQAHAESMMRLQNQSSMQKMERDTQSKITADEMEAMGTNAKQVAKGGATFTP